MLVDLSASSTYQEILREGLAKGMAQGVAQGVAQGRLDGIRDTLLAQAETRFGPPSIEVRTAIHSISKIPQLESLATRVLTAQSWQDLLKP